NRDKGQDDDDHREKNWAPDLAGSIKGDLQAFGGVEPGWFRWSVAGLAAFDFGEGLFGFLGSFGVADNVLRHDDGGIHEHADGDGDPGERHDVGADAEKIHQDERDEDGDRQRESDDENAAEMPKEDDVSQRD